MLSFALLIYLHLFTKQNRGIEQLSIALNFVELGNKLEKHVLHSSLRTQTYFRLSLVSAGVVT